MADKTKPSPKTQASTKTVSPQALQKTPQKTKPNPFKFLLILFLLISLLGAGFAAGVYFNFIDLQKISQTYKLYEYPVLNKYFPKQQTNFEVIPLEEQTPNEQAVNENSQPLQTASVQQAVAEKTDTPKVDLEREIKAKQLEEQKRLSKLARLYGGMKPDEAVAIMNQLDDETVLAILSKMEEEQVSKIMALFEPKKAASLTREMLKNKPAVPGKV